MCIVNELLQQIPIVGIKESILMAIWLSPMEKIERPAKFRMMVQSSISPSIAKDIMFAMMVGFIVRSS